MNVGDLVRTKTGEFGVGPNPKAGLVVACYNVYPSSHDIATVEVLQFDGNMAVWYPWQLKKM